MGVRGDRHPRQKPARHRASRFLRQESGSTAVEFALIAAPFIALIFGIIQTGFALFADQILQTRVTEAGRLIMTGQAQAYTREDFRNAVCSGTMSSLFNCNKLGIQSTAVANFSSASSSSMNTACETAYDPAHPNSATESACFDPGNSSAQSGGDSIVVVRVTYDWPYSLNLLALTNKTKLVATTVFRNEPWPASASTP
jgi:Flp pilus assembly protein TadG